MSGTDERAAGKSAPREGGVGFRALGALSLAALGVVYGDIGTSPLYAVRECFYGKYGVGATPENVLGVLSMVIWSLILVISIKYIALVLRADYDGEGGILALMELVRKPSAAPLRRLILPLGLFGAALLYGDGMITPAISVLSAIEGLNVATTAFEPYVLPITLTILGLLFVLQRIGTGGMGRLFGPVMLVWFLALATSGTAGILRDPSVLASFDPRHGAQFLLQHGWAGFTILGIVFLVVTGGEALYADLGHFGALPIRVAWFTVALPSLLLNYLGQGALILSSGESLTNPFYQLFPDWSRYAVVVLAACATVIASQAVISGAFSLTFQASRMGYLPRMDVQHTSGKRRGQIYIPVVNWVLLASTIGLVLGFRTSGNLASAYGVAIATTMVITTLLLFVAMKNVLGWRLRWAVPVTVLFLLVDLAFFGANIRKFIDGGWFPLAIAGVVFLAMETWRKGVAATRRKSRNRLIGVREFLEEIGGGGKYRRVPGQAVYLTGNDRGTPQSLRDNLEHNHALHDRVVLYTARFVKAPRVAPGEHLRIKRLREDITRIVAYHGYLEDPDVPGDLSEANRLESLGLDLDRITYFVGGDVLLARRKMRMSFWRTWIYALMAKNEMRATSHFVLPPDQVVEVRSQIQV